ncbi:unnamed protein product, partial [Phaeothamnion confervicola]
DAPEQLVADEGGLPIVLDGIRRLIPCTKQELSTVLLPLCAWLRWLVENAGKDNSSRILVGLVGPAGAGKSTLAHMLEVLCNKSWPASSGDEIDAKQEWAIALSMDAYHLPNAVLASGEAKGEDGAFYRLTQLKGLPLTLDAVTFAADLRRLRSREESPNPVSQTYDRVTHEPVPGRLRVTRAHRLVLVEGLHLLHRDDCGGAWTDVGACLDRIVFLNIPRDLCFERVVARKVSQGRDRADCERHFDRVDGPIYDRLQCADLARADI